MTKIFKFSLLLSIVIIAFTACSQDNVKDGVYKFEIYATNDIHGRLFDSLYVDKEVHPFSLSSVATLIKTAREENDPDNILFLDLGDHLQGDNAVFYSNFIDTISEHIFAKVANYLKYDAVIVGNHDIETGHAVYDKIIKEFDMPYLAANAINTKTDKPYFEPYTIINKGGLKIAVIGMTNPNVPNWLSEDLWEGMEFKEIVPTMNYWVGYVREKENPHFIVAAMHAGLGEDNSDDLENPARYVAKHVQGIDIVFAAHDHKVTAEKFINGDREVWLLEGGSRASTISKALVEVEIKNNKVVSKVVSGESIDVRGVEADKDFVDNFREHFLKVKEFTNQEIGMLTNDMASREAYFGPSAYVDMIHSLQLKASDADISFVAPLSFDAKIKEGVLNYQNLLDIYPFENQLNVIEMTGQEIKDYLEFSYAMWLDPNPKESGHLLNINVDDRGERGRFKNAFFNFDSAAGIIYEVDITKNNKNRINIISLANGQSFNLDARYKVALTSYRASGGGYLLEKGAMISKDEMKNRVVSRLADIREILYNQIKKEGVIEAKKLNQWKFVPEELANKLAADDYKLMFR